VDMCILYVRPYLGLFVRETAVSRGSEDSENSLSYMKIEIKNSDLETKAFLPALEPDDSFTRVVTPAGHTGHDRPTENVVSNSLGGKVATR
jgi:hypothetical protein